MNERIPFARGRVFVVVTGHPSRPHVAIEAEIVWRLPKSDAWSLVPASILPIRAVVSPRPGLEFLKELAGRAMAWREARPFELEKIGVVIESTAAPALIDAANSRFKAVFGRGTYGIRLVAGSSADRFQGIHRLVAVNSLSSLFHDTLETREDHFVEIGGGFPAPADTSLVAVSFRNYNDEDGGLSLSNLKAAISSADDLRTAGRPDGDEYTAASPQRGACRGANALRLVRPQLRAIRDGPSAPTQDLRDHLGGARGWSRLGKEVGLQRPRRARHED
jgi:hypothetical protein